MSDSQRSSFSLYLRALALAIVLCLVSVSLFNLFVDPYGLWRLDDIQGFNAAKSERRDQNYMFKAADLERVNPRVLLLGSSRVAFGLDPTHPAFGPEMQPVYNLGLTGGHMHSLRAYLEHALENSGDIELVIWGLDFFVFNVNVDPSPTFDERRLHRSSIWLPDVRDALLSMDAFRASLSTVGSNSRRPEYEPYTAMGQLTTFDMRAQVRREGMVARFDESLSLYVNSKNRFANFEESELAWSELAEIVSLLESRNIDLIAYVSPVHMTMLEGMYQRDVWDDYLSWLARLSDHFSYWDFAGPNRITGEPVAREMRYYWDASHYRSNVGDLVLSTMLESQPASEERFGELVSESTIQAHLRALRDEMDEWRRSNQYVIDYVSSKLR